MAAKTELMRVGDLELLVETTPVAGTEPTSKPGDVGLRVLDAFERAKDAMVEIASSTAEVIGRMAERAARPDHLEVQFGLSIAANGNIIVASASAEATITVTLSYDASKKAEPAPNGQATPGG
jgi:hypothetical protein